MKQFIVFEGPDGVGKTVQAARLARTLREAGGDVLETREPTDRGPIGGAIRFLLTPLPPLRLDHTWRDMALLFSADRAVHVHNLFAPALAAGRTVICDRYLLSTLIYQTVSFWRSYRAAVGDVAKDAALVRFQEARNWIADINRWCPVPDVTFVLRSGDAEKRRATRGPADLYEADPQQQAAIASMYASAAAWLPEARVVPVDGDGPEDTVARRVLQAFLELPA